MKHYAIVFLPEPAFKSEVENWRKENTGSELADGMPPHITIKRRFWLKENFNESELLNLLDKFSIKSFLVKFGLPTKLNEVSALVGESSYLTGKHKELLNLLKYRVETQNPEWENENFKIHLTLLRNNLNDIPLDIKDSSIKFDSLCLYELDPTHVRGWTNKIWCKKLS